MQQTLNEVTSLAIDATEAISSSYKYPLNITKLIFRFIYYIQGALSRFPSFQQAHSIKQMLLE